MEERKAADFRQVYIIFVILAVLTAAEFIVSTNLNAPVLLLLIALAKAALIVQFFMHVYRLWREEEH
ncbi:MAG: cytochrome C oxidase subunit IV family protein [Chloroflexota bacterium]